jgi:hypothetical protein
MATRAAGPAAQKAGPGAGSARPADVKCCSGQLLV